MANIIENHVSQKVNYLKNKSEKDFIRYILRKLPTLSGVLDQHDTFSSESESESQNQRLPWSSVPTADITAEKETMAQRRGSINDSFHLPNFPHMAWVDPSALPTIVIVPSLRELDSSVFSHRNTLFSPSAFLIHIVSHEDDAKLAWIECVNG